MRRLQLPQVTIEYTEPVVKLLFNEDCELDVPEMKQLIRAVVMLTEEKPYLLFSDARVHLNITPEARLVAASREEVPLLIANAVLVNNLPTKLLATFFKQFNKPHFPFKIFTDEEKALAWLLKQNPVPGVKSRKAEKQ